MTRQPPQGLVHYATGFSAMAFSLYFLAYEGRGDWLILLASSFFLLICITDTFQSQIPNLANLALLLSGFGYNFYMSGASGLVTACWGLLIGFALLLLPYLMGGMGAGDVKALAALGALVGPGDIVQVFLYTAWVGALMAIIHYAMAHNLKNKCLAGLTALRTFAYTRDYRQLKPTGPRERLRFPYAAAITFGFFAFIHWGALV